MIVRLENLVPRTKVEAPLEVLEEYKVHFAQKLQEYGFFIDKFNTHQFNALVKYFARYCAGIKGKASRPEKGLFLYGKCGTGKTLAMQIFSGLFQVEFIPVWKLSETFSRYGADAFWGNMNDYRGKDLIIDDIGNESMSKNFGNTFPIVDFLASRASDSALTFFTSNAAGAQVTDLYGDYIYSRICGMCEPVKFDGVDYRRKKK